MTNLFPNLQTFLTEIQSYIETVTEQNGKIILTLKQEILANPDSYRAFITLFNPLKRRLRLEYYIEQKFVTKPYRLPWTNYDYETVDLIEFHIDILSIHIDRLKDYFQQGTSKADVAESIGFIMKNGWSEREFQSEIGLSRSTFFRYMPKNEASTSENSNVMASGTQPLTNNNSL
jgi:hypothetical protein